MKEALKARIPTNMDKGKGGILWSHRYSHRSSFIQFLLVLCCHQLADGRAPREPGSSGRNRLGKGGAPSQRRSSTGESTAHSLLELPILESSLFWRDISSGKLLLLENSLFWRAPSTGERPLLKKIPL